MYLTMSGERRLGSNIRHFMMPRIFGFYWFGVEVGIGTINILFV